MKPLTFCLENSVEMIPDARRRDLAAMGRKLAEDGFDFKWDYKDSDNYWEGVIEQHEMLVALDAYGRRKARLERMKVNG